MIVLKFIFLFIHSRMKYLYSPNVYFKKVKSSIRLVSQKMLTPSGEPRNYYRSDRRRRAARAPVMPVRVGCMDWLLADPGEGGGAPGRRGHTEVGQTWSGLKPAAARPCLGQPGPQPSSPGCGAVCWSTSG